MTTESQRIVIAEAMGFTNVGIGATGGIYGHRDDLCGVGNERCSLPNYLSDLNAMHEAEKVLTPDQCDKMRYYLVNILEYGDCSASTYVFHATAAQRAEAFLRTLNLWKD